MVAAVVLGVHRALERRGRPVEERRADEPACDREPVELLGALARELPGERFLVGGEQVQGEAGRLEPDVEAARAPVDAPENERRLLRDRREAHHHEPGVTPVRMRRGDDDDARRPRTRRGADRLDVDGRKLGRTHPPNTDMSPISE